MADQQHEKYMQFLQLVGTETPITENDWLFHFDHQNAGASSGIELGEAAPDFALPDHSGFTRSRSELMGRQGLLLVFARSADW